MTTWLITGCSTGLGRALATAVLDAGHNAIITARDAATVTDLAEAHPDSAFALALDVTDKDRIREVARLGEERFGGIDVLVNNAGYGYRAAVEEGDQADIDRLFDTHVFGPVAAIQAVLPGMRARRNGTIINISSIGVRLQPAGSGFYVAAKAALEGITGSLAKEVGPLGIHAIAVEPGGFRTDYSGRSLTQSPGAVADYADTAGQRRLERDDTHGTQPGDPAKAAAAILQVAEAAEPPTLLVLGTDAVTWFRMFAQFELDQVTAWEELSRSTDFAVEQD